MPTVHQTFTFISAPSHERRKASRILSSPAAEQNQLLPGGTPTHVQSPHGGRAVQQRATRESPSGDRLPSGSLGSSAVEPMQAVLFYSLLLCGSELLLRPSLQLLEVKVQLLTQSGEAQQLLSGLVLLPRRALTHRTTAKQNQSALRFGPTAGRHRFWF